jgi:hypothetical protein
MGGHMLILLLSIKTSPCLMSRLSPMKFKNAKAMKKDTIPIMTTITHLFVILLLSKMTPASNAKTFIGIK